MKIASEAGLALDRDDLREWDQTTNQKNSLSRFNHVKKFDDLGITFEVAILPVPSVNQRWMVMIRVWWHDSFILDL